MPSLPPVNSLLVALLRPALAPVKFGTRIIAAMPYPYVMARGAGGDSVDPRFLSHPQVDVQVWAKSETQAEELSYRARDILFQAWRNQTVVPGVGSIARFRDQALPDEIPGAPKGVIRYQATYDLMLRPA